MGEHGGGRHRAGGQDRYDGADHTADPDPGALSDEPGPLSDAAAERLLDTPWAVRFRLVAQNGSAARNANSPSNASYLPGFEDSAVAADPARMKYSAGRDGADDGGGPAGARGTAGPEDPQGLQDPAAASGARWRGDVAGSTDSGGETTMSSVDYPADLASPDAQAVARILAAAAAPARPHELRGYETARRAFERAGATPVNRGFGVPLRRLIGVKMAAVAGALTVTGVAVAAEADVLPAPIQKVAHQVLGGVGVPDPDPDPTSQTAAPGASSGSSSQHPGTPRPTGSGGAPAGSSGPNGGAVPGTPTGTVDGSGPSSSADADVPALCRAYTDQQQGKGSALSGKDRRRLATLAGGEDKIDDFCAKVLAAAPTGKPSENPGSSTESPNPSKDHKPTGTSAPSPPPTGPDDQSGNASGHSHTPSPSHPAH